MVNTNDGLDSDEHRQQWCLSTD